MNSHWQYLKYVLRHKWFVFIYGREIGLPFWQLLIHDWTKFLPSEWFPYVDNFYGDDIDSITRTEWLRAGLPIIGDWEQFREKLVNSRQSRFESAWNHHQKRNPHHWQYWLLTMDTGAEIVLEMPEKYRLEMLADWRGAGRAITGEDNTADWYLSNRDKMRLHPNTRSEIERYLGVHNAGIIKS